MIILISLTFHGIGVRKCHYHTCSVSYFQFSMKTFSHGEIFNYLEKVKCLKQEGPPAVENSPQQILPGSYEHGK